MQTHVHPSTPNYTQLHHSIILQHTNCARAGQFIESERGLRERLGEKHNGRNVIKPGSTPRQVPPHHLLSHPGFSSFFLLQLQIIRQLFVTWTRAHRCPHLVSVLDKPFDIIVIPCSSVIEPPLRREIRSPTAQLQTHYSRCKATDQSGCLVNLNSTPSIFFLLVSTRLW